MKHVGVKLDHVYAPNITPSQISLKSVIVKSIFEALMRVLEILCDIFLFTT